MIENYKEDCKFRD